MPEMGLKINDKNIVIWGVGVLQTDLEGLYSFPSLLYYVDDDLREENMISVSPDEIFPSSRLEREERDRLLVIVCTPDQDDAVAGLKRMGYGEENYILGEELLAAPSLYHRICAREISVWGTGYLYASYEDELRRYVPDVTRFIVTEKREESFRGKEVVSLKELQDGAFDSYILVSTIYYKEIYKSLTALGLRPGKDFLHIETMLAMGALAGGVDGTFLFDDRKKDREDLLVVLAGYKEFVWDSVFGRLEAFVPEHVDVCIVTSGLVNPRLRKMCETYQWSYMSTDRNHVSLAVNLAIWHHPEARYIYKMDEDIFLTKGVFETLKATYEKVQQESRYEVGFVTPLIPVNGYGYVRLLEIFGADQLWKERFGELKYTIALQHHRTIQKNPEAARFMWGEGNPAMENLDRVQERLQARAFQYSVCPVRYSIGFILFHRENWIRLRGFPVTVRNLGMDETALCEFCMMQSRAMVVAENAVVGHLAYNPQNEAMKEYYYAHKEKFQLSV